MATVADTEGAAQTNTGLGRSFWLLIGAVGLLLIVGIVVAVVGTRSNGTSYPANSPEGTVQRYVVLLQSGKVDRAYAMTDLIDTRQEFHNQFDSWNKDSHRVTLVHTYKHGSEASVTVDVGTFSGGPYGASDNTQRTTFTLQRHGVGWRIVGPEYLPY
ncbi:MAG: hypothetical protein PVSMB7_28810 [Chloroflexota bacterium]